MKILRVINTLKMGGAERSLETNVPVHIKHGYDMDVLVLDGEQTPFMDRLEKAGVHIIKLNGMSLRNPLQIFRIKPYLKEYDIVHVHLFPALYWTAFAKLLSYRKPKFVFTVHSTSDKRRNKLLFRLMDRFIYNCYDRIITISPAAQINFVGYLGRDKDIVMVANGVDLKPFAEQNDTIELFPGSNGCFVITQIASFREQKDQDTVIRALTKTDCSVHAVFVGVGDRIEICKELAEKTGVGNRVHFLGSRMDVPAIVKSSSVIVMSSNSEGFGRAAIEGMAGGKPVIGSDVPGLRDLVDGAGLLFDVGDYDTLSEQIEQLRTDHALYAEKAAACLSRAQEYSSERMIAGYEAVYNELMERNK